MDQPLDLKHGDLSFLYRPFWVGFGFESHLDDGNTALILSLIKGTRIFTGG